MDRSRTLWRRRFTGFLGNHVIELVGIIIAAVGTLFAAWQIEISRPGTFQGLWSITRQTFMSGYAAVVILLTMIFGAGFFIRRYWQHQYLVGRDRETRLFQKMISGRSPEQILLLHGEEGSGKSLLVDVLIRIAETKRMKSPRWIVANRRLIPWL